MARVNLVKHGITHFLRIPYATVESTPQILYAVERLAQDPIAAALPRAAWCRPGQFHLPIGTLSLKTPDRMDTAVRILNKLKSWYSTARSTSEDKPCSRENGLLNLAQPPIIALQGLRKDDHFPETKELTCYVKEPRPFLAGFRSFVMDSFVAEGLMPVPPTTGTFREVTQNIMKTDFLRSNVLNDKITLRGKGFYQSPKFDVSDLLPKYEDFPWTNNFPLEKLCITEMGLQDLYRKGKFIGETYRDIACIPLPGVSASEVTAGHPEDQYTKAARSRRKNFPVTPLLIPSMPPV